MKKPIASMFAVVRRKFHAQFGFKVGETSFSRFVGYLHAPKDSSSLAVTRILFGAAMMFDIPDERGGSMMEKRWGDPKICHFPLLPFIQPLPLPYMAVVYAGMWFGALGITLGYKYRFSAATFVLCYWYLFLIEKSFWNNHSYLFGLVALLMSFTDAACYWSLDSYISSSKSPTVPYWNYFILKYQFFILYFMAGVKKGTAEWLTGYSVLYLSEHWVFAPFRLFLTVEQTDYLIVHWFVFLFDLTVALWMMCSTTRHVAMLFCAMFHLMNSRLFMIGMFPWVCLATMPLFYPFDWPKTLTNTLLELKNKMCRQISQFKQSNYEPELLHEPKYKRSNDDDESFDNVMEQYDNSDINQAYDDTKEDKNYETDAKDALNFTDDELKELEVEQEIQELEEDIQELHDERINDKETAEKRQKSSCKQRVTVFLILFHVISQAFLPFSHFITQGYNNWTNGLYGYSWDMMVHSWDNHAVIIEVVDNYNHLQFYVDPDLYVLNDRWTRHGDMVYQYARCLRDQLEESRKPKVREPSCQGLEEVSGDLEDSRNLNDQFEHSRKNLEVEYSLEPKEILEYTGKAEDAKSPRGPSTDVSIYIDAWYSLNGRFVQRLFDPKVDLLKAEWSPFKKVPYLMPLLDEGLEWRADLDQMRREVHSWSNYSDVVFLADFPGYEQEKYISENLTNVTLTVLQGIAAYQLDVIIGQSLVMHAGDRVSVPSGLFHKVLNIGKEPVFYMYTYSTTEVDNSDRGIPKLPLLYELYAKFYKICSFHNVMFRYLGEIIFSSCTSGKVY